MSETTETPELTPEELRKEKLAKARAKWVATREANKLKQQQMLNNANEVKNDIQSLKEQTELIKSQLEKQYLCQIEDLRKEIQELKSVKKKERTLRRVEIYDDAPDHEEPENVKFKQVNSKPVNPFNTFYRR